MIEVIVIEMIMIEMIMIEMIEMIDHGLSEHD